MNRYVLMNTSIFENYESAKKWYKLANKDDKIEGLIFSKDDNDNLVIDSEKDYHNNYNEYYSLECNENYILID